MKTVWKYELNIQDGPQSFLIPKFAKIVLVAEQRGLICLWMEVDEKRQKECRAFVIFVTGHEVKGRHCGSVVIGPFVWHIYEQEV